MPASFPSSLSSLPSPSTEEINHTHQSIDYITAGHTYRSARGPVSRWSWILTGALAIESKPPAPLLPHLDHMMVM